MQTSVCHIIHRYNTRATCLQVHARVLVAGIAQALGGGGVHSPDEAKGQEDGPRLGPGGDAKDGRGALTSKTLINLMQRKHN